MSTDPAILELRREYVAVAIDGAVLQLATAARFLADGHDHYAVAAFARGVEFVRRAAPEIKQFESSDAQPGRSAA